MPYAHHRTHGSAVVHARGRQFVQQLCGQELRRCYDDRYSGSELYCENRNSRFAVGHYHLPESILNGCELPIVVLPRTDWDGCQWLADNCLRYCDDRERPGGILHSFGGDLSGLHHGHMPEPG